MTERVRKRVSKWDLKEDPSSFQNEIGQNNACSSKVSEPIHDQGSKSEWKPSKGSVSDPNLADTEPNVAMQPKGNYGGSQQESSSGTRVKQKDGRSRWESSSGTRVEQKDEWSRWQSSSGTRAEQKDENSNRYSHEISETKNTSGEDKSYSTSPGLDGWRRRSRSLSPKDGWSRSRSRSPSWGFRRESEGRSDRMRSGSGVSGLICKDFARGRCARGSQCRFLHQDNHDYDSRNHSGNGSADDWVSKHENEGYSGRNSVERGYSRSKSSQGRQDHYDENGEKHEALRNSRSSNLCNNFLKGRCYKGSSCMYIHDDTLSDGNGARLCSNKSWDANASFGADRRREPYRKIAIPCKFFASGNCRNGESCRFSHEGTAQDRSEENSRDSRRGYNLENEHRSWEGSKWGAEAADSKLSEKAVDSDMAKFQQWRNDDNGGNMGHKTENTWGGPQWTDQAAEPGITKAPQWRNNDNSVKVGVAISQYCLDDQNRTSGAPWSVPSGPNVHESPRRISGNMGGWVSRGHCEVLPCVENGTEFQQFIGNGETAIGNYGLQPGSQQNITLPTLEQNITQGVSDQHHNAPTVVLQPQVSENVHIQQHCSSTFPCPNSDTITNNSEPQIEVHVSEGVVPTVDHVQVQNIVNQPHPSFNVEERQVQQINPSPGPSVQTFDLNGPAQEMFSHTSSKHLPSPPHAGETLKRPDIVDQQMSPINSGTPMAQNIVTSEQVAKLSDLSASLAHIMAKGQQLPQLYATLSSRSMGLLPSHPNTGGPVAPVLASFGQANQGIWVPRQYNPISEIIDSSNIHPPGFEQNKSAEQESQTPMKSIGPCSDGGGGGDPCTNLEKSVDHRRRKELQAVDGERAGDDKTKEKDSNSEDTNGDEEGRKNKDAKGMRMFKFALVELVKEILKPTWKEGQMSKEAHKTIVKKVVDKVTGSVPGDHIPQTQEKVEQYLAYSKPKLTKLVQAYVDKYLKT